MTFCFGLGRQTALSNTCKARSVVMRDCIDPLPGSRLLANDERVFLDALRVKIRDAPSRALLRNTLPGSEQACTLGVVRYHDPALPCVLQPIARSVSLVFFKQIFQHNIVQHGVCQKALQLSVLILQRFKAVGVRNFHSRDIAPRYPAVQCMPPYLALNL